MNQAKYLQVAVLNHFVLACSWPRHTRSLYGAVFMQQDYWFQAATSSNTSGECVAGA